MQTKFLFILTNSERGSKTNNVDDPFLPLSSSMLRKVLLYGCMVWKGLLAEYNGQVGRKILK